MTPKTLLPALDCPAVSILICNYNNERFVEAAVHSALEQTLDCEVIVVDDGSTDGSVARLRRFGDRIRLICQPNAGQLGAYETAYAASRGAVVLFLDADDTLTPNAAQTVSGLFAAGVAKVHFRMAVIDAEGRPTGVCIPSSLAHGDVLPALVGSGVLYASAPGSGNAYRRDVLDRLWPLPADPADRHGADLFVIYGSVFFGTVAAAEEVLGGYRMHVASGSGGDPLLFGNAEQRSDAAERLVSRLARFRHWIAQRLPEQRALPARFLDFSAQKTFFARQALAGHRNSWSEGRWLLRAIWRQPAYSLVKQVALSAWTAAVLVLPRRLAYPIARHVCNPASRGAAR